MTRAIEDHPYYNARVNVIAREVAKTFGGKILFVRDDDPLTEYHATVKVEPHGATPGYKISIYIPYPQKKVTVRLLPYEQDNDIRTNDFPNATMTADRDLQALMADISRRVVNHAEAIPALKRYAAKLEKKRACERGVKDHLAKILAAVPSAYVSPGYPANSYEGRFFGRGGDKGVGYDARVYADGKVQIDRMGSVTLDQALRILNILGEKPTG